jgi:hypothetical protein
VANKFGNASIADAMPAPMVSHISHAPSAMSRRDDLLMNRPVNSWRRCSSASARLWL